MKGDPISGKVNKKFASSPWVESEWVGKEQVLFLSGQCVNFMRHMPLFCFIFYYLINICLTNKYNF